MTTIEASLRTELERGADDIDALITFAELWLENIPQFEVPPLVHIRAWIRRSSLEIAGEAIRRLKRQVERGKFKTNKYCWQYFNMHVQALIWEAQETARRDAEVKQQALFAKGSNGSKLVEQLHGAWAIMCAGDWKSVTLANTAAAMAPYENRKQRYAARGLWVRYVLSVPRACRIITFSEASEHLSDEIYFKLLWHVYRHVGVKRNSNWVYSYHDSHVINDGLLAELLKVNRPGIERFCFTPEDAAYWKSLPEEVTAYRGHGQVNRAGLYWSLNRETGAEYARQYGQFSSIEERVLEKRKCVYIGGVEKQVLYLDYATGDAA